MKSWHKHVWFWGGNLSLALLNSYLATGWQFAFVVGVVYGFGATKILFFKPEKKP